MGKGIELDTSILPEILIILVASFLVGWALSPLFVPPEEPEPIEMPICQCPTAAAYASPINDCAMQGNTLESFERLGTCWRLDSNQAFLLLTTKGALNGRALEVKTFAQGNGEFYISREFYGRIISIWVKSEKVDNSTSPFFQVLLHGETVAGIECNFGSFTYNDGNAWLPIDDIKPEPNTWYQFKLINEGSRYGLKIADLNATLASLDGLHKQGSLEPWENATVRLGIYDRHHSSVSAWFDELKVRQ